MKKILILFMIVVMISSICIPGFADADSITVMAKDKVYTNSGEIDAATGMVLIYTGQTVGFEVESEKPITEVKLGYRTGGDCMGILSITLDDPNGELLASVDTRNVASATWADYTSMATLNRPVSDKHVFYVSTTGPAATSCHWITDITFYMGESTDPWFSGLGDQDNYIDVESYNDERKINTLSDLGIADSRAATYYYPNVPITRREFMKMIGKAVNAESYAVEEMPFLDVPADDTEAKTISGLYQLGIVRGDDSGYFAPDRFISVNEGASVCANVLGYGPVIRTTGDLIGIANQLKLSKGIDFGCSYLSRIASVRLIYNLFTADNLMLKEVLEGGVIYKSEGSILEQNLGIHYGKGVVTNNKASGLYSVGSYQGLKIGGEVFSAGLTNPGGYLGVLCEYFYRVENDENTLVSIYPAEKTSCVVLKTGKDGEFKEISDLRITYDDYDRETEYDISAQASIIYNGVALDRPISDVLDVDTFRGIITLVDNDDDMVYDSMRIDHGKTIIVDAIGTTVIKDKLTNTSISTNDLKILVYQGDSLVNQELVGADTVLTMYQSANVEGKKLLRLRMNDNKVKGQITDLSEDEATIDGVVYSISSACQKDLEVGMTAVFQLNDFNEIVTCKSDTTAGAQVGFLLEIYYDSTKLDSKNQLKILTESGISIFENADKICADGVYLSKNNDFYEGKGLFRGLKNLAMKQPILYRLNTDGKITLLDTVEAGAGGEEDGLTRLSPSKTYRKIGGFLITIEDIGWMNRFPFRGNTKYIIMPTGKSEKFYRLTTGFIAPEDRTLDTTTPYALKPDSIFADIIVSDNYIHALDEESLNVPFVFKQAGTKVDEEGNNVKFLRGMQANNDTTLTASADSYNENSDFKNVIDSLQPGDLIWAIIQDGKLEDAKLIYTATGAVTNLAGCETLINTEKNMTSFDDTHGMQYGSLTDPEEGFMMLTLNGGTEKYPYNLKTSKAVICSKDEDGRMTILSRQRSEEILSTDKVLIYMNDRSISGIYVYRGTSE